MWLKYSPVPPSSQKEKVLHITVIKQIIQLDYKCMSKQHFGILLLLCKVLKASFKNKHIFPLP